MSNEEAAIALEIGRCTGLLCSSNTHDASGTLAQRRGFRFLIRAVLLLGSTRKG
ncbi:hypothetical protein [Paracoccus sp. pheM1]|uniref:hypothetical protein n=1 Tax=Paracoccus sp. pheM1 TaxID=2831675 RepID=UPI001BDB77AC|nr:hypothetical protein [Paracoccus sp. pheM1]MBT0779725.1 hypothetical protein [Paracoccus sp. pheM1]